MNAIPKSAPLAAITDAWCKNMLCMFRLFGTAASVDYVETPLFARWHAQLAHPYFEGVQVFEKPAGQAGAFVQEQIDYFQARGVESFTWWLHPPLINKDWEAVLFEHGFTFDSDSLYMALSLAELPDSVRWPDGLEIRVVEDQASMQTWIDAFMTSYGFQPEWKGPFSQVLSQVGYNLPLRHYIGFLNDTPVTTSSLFLSEGIAGIWYVATHKDLRGKGLGSAITWQPLKDAQQMGYSFAALDSTKAGYPVYFRLGFREISCPGNFTKILG